MIVDMVAHEHSPGITALSLPGRLVVGNRMSDVEHAIRETIKRGSRKPVLDFNGLSFMDSAGVGPFLPPATEGEAEARDLVQEQNSLGVLAVRQLSLTRSAARPWDGPSRLVATGCNRQGTLPPRAPRPLRRVSSDHAPRARTAGSE